MLRTDTSDRGWGTQLCRNCIEIKACAQEWERKEKNLHITHREALASAKAVHFMLPHIAQGSSLKIETDASSTAWCWTKGSKIPGMNSAIRAAAVAAATKKIFVTAAHIPGCTNTRADWLSRNPDPKNYRLNPQIFHKICHVLGFHPEVDLFSNRHNSQVKQFCSWRVDPKSLGNAFAIKWTGKKCWLNPPWEMIPRCLQKLQEDNATALVCLPIWRSAPWWRTVLKMQHGPSV